jgi:translation initiation factor 1
MRGSEPSPTMNFEPFQTNLERSIHKSKVHIRVQQRNGKKCITSIEGLDDDLDQKRICKHMRKLFNCNGNVIHDELRGDIIQLQGDQRDNVRAFLLEQTVIEPHEKDRLVVHGF